MKRSARTLLAYSCKRVIMKKNILVLFDLDGVLLNSRANMEYAWSSVREKFPSVTSTASFEDYFALIGRPFDDILLLLGIVPAPEIQKEYSRASKEGHHLVSVFQGVRTTLSKLKIEGYRLGIVTSKDKERTTLMMEDAGIMDYFEEKLIFSPNEKFRGKPAPDHLLHAMVVANVDPSSTIYIGDMKTDAEASVRAGCRFIFASWGYSQEKIALSSYWNECQSGLNSPEYLHAENMGDIHAFLTKFAQYQTGVM